MTPTPIKLNLGCGQRKIAGYINVDIRPEMNPDLVCDIKNMPFGDSTVSEVRAYDILEHIPMGQTREVIEEIYRVLTPDGLFEHFTPDCTKGQGAFQDPYHISFWCPNSFLYYMEDALRNLYDIKAKFVGSNDRVTYGGDVWHIHGKLYAIKPYGK
jgi:predicted SAM-dependent methyltransferase